MASAAVEPTASVKATPAMGLSAAVEAVTAAELTASMEVTATIAVAAVEVTTAVAAIEAASIAAVTVITAAAVISATVAVSAAVVAVSVIAVEPGAGADEDAAGEPIRTVVAVGCAGVRIIIVVAISTDWRGAVIGRGANSNAEGDALGLYVRSGEETNTETNAE
jgi:hypothetical protein